MPLRKKERNEVFDLVQKSGMSPLEFSWDVVADRSRIAHLPTGQAFEFGVGEYSGRGPLGAYMNFVQQLLEGSWRAQRRLFRSWLKDLKEEVDTPDAWAFLESGARASFWDAATDDGAENTPFSPDEQAQVIAQLEQLRIAVRDRYVLSDAQVRALDSKIDELIDASRRLGRKDWMAVFLGVMLTLVVTAVLTPEEMQRLIEEFARGVVHLFSPPPGLPQPPS